MAKPMITNRNRKLHVAVVAGVIVTAITVSAQNPSTGPRINRPPADGREDWMNDYDLLSPEERTGELWIEYKDKDGNTVRDSRPQTYDDPQVITMRKPNGDRIRLIEPSKLQWVDIPPILKQQEELIVDRQRRLREQQAILNTAIEERSNEFYDAKGEAAEAQSLLNELEAERSDTERRWALSNYSYCPNSTNYADCTHPEHRQQWLNDRQAALDALQRQLQIASSRLSRAVRRGQETKAALDEAKSRRQQLIDGANAFKGIVNRQNNGELWLYPGGKSPLYNPTPGAKIIYDESAPRR